MYYKDFQDKKLSALGFGCMRLPVIGEHRNRIDMDTLGEMVSYAMAHGVNYFDAGWRYHEGNAETAIGQILQNYPRDTFYLADKLPGFTTEHFENKEHIFETQLKKCGVDYFDFYLFHNVMERNIDHFLNPQYGVLKFLMSQKERGRIRHLGFSAHANLENLKRFLDAYGEHMEFGQLQINWFDWDYQNARAKMELLQERGIAVWVMEPVRGGVLAKLENSMEARLKQQQPQWSIPEWAFRFIQSQDCITMTLSGMSNLTQMQENIKTFETRMPLSKEEDALLMNLAREIAEKKAVPCTGCRYCTEHCPKELDIPLLLKLRNEFSVTEGGFIPPSVIASVTSLPEDKQPDACIGCRRCEAVCPQNIPVSGAMAELSENLNNRK